MNKILKKKIKEVNKLFKDILFNYSENGKGEWLVVPISKEYMPSKHIETVRCDRPFKRKRIILKKEFIRSINLQNFTTRDKYFSENINIQLDMNELGMRYLHNNCNISIAWMREYYIELDIESSEYYYFETEDEAKLFIECKD